jgi:hypothetical protein
MYNKLRFIGELFNENLLSAHILEEFLKIVPEILSNNTLENICGLLKVAGKKIEQVIERLLVE